MIKKYIPKCSDLVKHGIVITNSDCIGVYE